MLPISARGKYTGQPGSAGPRVMNCCASKGYNRGSGSRVLEFGGCFSVVCLLRFRVFGLGFLGLTFFLWV